MGQTFPNFPNLNRFYGQLWFGIPTSSGFCLPNLYKRHSFTSVAGSKGFPCSWPTANIPWGQDGKSLTKITPSTRDRGVSARIVMGRIHCSRPPATDPNGFLTIFPSKTLWEVPIKFVTKIPSNGKSENPISKGEDSTQVMNPTIGAFFSFIYPWTQDSLPTAKMTIPKYIYIYMYVYIYIYVW